MLIQFICKSAAKDGIALASIKQSTMIYNQSLISNYTPVTAINIY